MKKVIVIFTALLIAGNLLAQRSTYDVTIPIPTGDDTTFVENFFTGSSFSLHYWYESLDNTDGTLALYGSNWVNDTAAYQLLFIDEASDGANDNPKTLSDSVWIIWADSFPFQYLIQKFTKVSNTKGNIFGKGRKQ